MSNTTIIESTATPVGQMTLLGVLRIPAVRQVLLLFGVAAAVAAGFTVMNWSQTPSYAPLYRDLDSADAAQIVEALRAADIEYKLGTDTGSVMVPEGRLHDARLELASQGLPSGATVGMDSIQDQSSFGVSQFMEGARYQYALETELAKTIAHLGSVRDARVHLALPKQSAFIRDQKSASASVLLQLFRGRMLEPDQASAIVHLVASSVPNLTASDVTLVDQHGRLLSSDSDEWGNAKTLKHFEISERIEKTYANRIEELLTPLVGPGRVRAKVVANMDFTVTEETRESFDPEGSVVRSEEFSEQERLAEVVDPQGVPGALSNQPPEAIGAAAESASSESVQTKPLNSSRSSVRNFEVDRTISTTRPQAGQIQRLSVAVLVDDSPVGESDESGQQALDESDIQRFTSLVKEAVGFDEARGDTVVVVNAAFRGAPEQVAADEPPFWERPAIRDTIKQAIGVILVLVLAFGIVRPMLRSLVASNMTSSGQFLAAGGASALSAPSENMLGGGNPAIAPPAFDEKISAARNMTRHDPARVAQVVKKWVTTDG